VNMASLPGLGRVDSEAVTSAVGTVARGTAEWDRASPPLWWGSHYSYAPLALPVTGARAAVHPWPASVDDHKLPHACEAHKRDLRRHRGTRSQYGFGKAA